jgi:HSP20 family protein
MSMRRINPWRQLRDEVDRLFSDFSRTAGNWQANWVPRRRAFPALNVWQSEHEVWAEAELPGVTEGDLEISVVGNELSIKGQRTTSLGDEALYHRQERGVGAFSRVVTLPVEVDPDKVEATLKDGVLTIRLPKAESAKPRKITVKVGASN